MPTTWNADVQRRRKALAALAQISGSAPDADGFFWNDGRYLIVHYDLLTISKSDQPLNRSAVYSSIETTLVSLGGIALGGSVYALALPLKAVAVTRAVGVWNSISAATKGKLVEGDAFYLHYSSDKLNQLKSVGQVIAAGKTSLAVLNMPPLPATP